MISEIVLASSNKGKIKELQYHLESLQIKVTPQTAYHVEDADETGLTFVENAILKARHAAEKTGLPALADDSGLEVDALKGAPGIYSARYSGDDATDAKNNQKLLKALENLPENERTARFRCVLVLMRHALDPTPLICQGTWEGYIATEPQGENGFGYDPLFIVSDLNICSAQLSPEEKNRMSHRGQALNAFSEAVADFLGMSKEK